IDASLTEDQRFLVITAANTTSGNELYIKDLSKANSPIINIINNFDQEYSILDNQGNSLLIYTNLDAPNYRVVRANINELGSDKWKDLIPETENVLNVSIGGGKIFANYLKDATSLVQQYDYSGKLERSIDLPDVGTASGFSAKENETELYYSFTSYIYPPTIYKYTINSGESSEYKKAGVDFDPSLYESKQVFYQSKDGTKIPMIITYKKGIQLDGNNPTLLYGYGGFNISLSPSFSTSNIILLEQGGVYAVANLRGGGEYGEKWHIAGTKMNKQNVFDDFIAAGEYLIQEKYTANEYLAIAGGSNGGLLVGATMTQRPDLAKVAFTDVGALDMLRYHTFTAGAGWAYDYGTSEESQEMFEYLRKYSPVHAVKPGTKYPATLVTTADHDDRVVPAHSFKFAATLQEHHAGENPVLIRVDVKSGHSASNLSKTIEKIADQYSFAWYNMNVIPPVAKKDM